MLSLICWKENILHNLLIMEEKMDIIKLIFGFAGGLGMFLYGMHIMSDGLQKSAGGKLKQLLGYLTRNKLVAVIVGALVTAIIQSSSATTVMVVGFVNAGMINLSQAIGVIMGANIGTTITAWIVSMGEWSVFLKPDITAPLFIGIAAFIILFFGKNRKKQNIGEIIMGFGLLFMGLSVMSSAIKPYQNSPVFADAFAKLGKNPFLGILVGALVTAIVQSSSASLGILQTLAMSMTLSWTSVIYITLGQNIGTCITAMLASVGANKTAKRASVIHLLFNTTGAIFFGIIMYIIFRLNPVFANSRISSTGISIFHTIFNVSNTLLLLPFSNKLIKISGFFVRDKDDKDELALDSDVRDLSKHLDDRLLESPSFAISTTIEEALHMGQVVLNNTKCAMKALIEGDSDMARNVFEKEEVVDTQESIITEYLIKLNNSNLSEKQRLKVNNLFYLVNDMERIGDHAENLAELAMEKIENNVLLSDDAYAGLDRMGRAAISSLENALKAVETNEMSYIKEVQSLENIVDELRYELRQGHIERLSQGICISDNGVIYTDAIINIERISDHSFNIVNYVKDELEEE